MRLLCETHPLRNPPAESRTEVDSGVRQTEVVSGLPLSSVHTQRATPKWIPVGVGPMRL